MATPLADWLSRQPNLTAAALARKLGIGFQRLDHYLKGRRTPRGPQMRALVALTGLSWEQFLTAPGQQTKKKRVKR